MQDYIDPSLPQDVQQAIRRDMPYNPRAVIPRASVLGAMEDPNTIGWVDPRMGPTIFYNRNSSNLRKPTLPGHELEHVLQHDVTKRYPKGYDGTVIDEYWRMRGGDEKANDPKKWRAAASVALTNHLINVGKNVPLADYLTKISGVQTAPYIGKVPDNGYSLKEQWAELSAIEQYVKKDLTRDPYIRKEFFGDDEALINTYRGVTGLRTNRLDARDLPPMTAQPTPRLQPIQAPLGIMERIMQYLK